MGWGIFVGALLDLAHAIGVHKILGFGISIKGRHDEGEGDIMWE